MGVRGHHALALSAGRQPTTADFPPLCCMGSACRPGTPPLPLAAQRYLLSHKRDFVRNTALCRALRRLTCCTPTPLLLVFFPLFVPGRCRSATPSSNLPLHTTQTPAQRYTLWCRFCGCPTTVPPPRAACGCHSHLRKWLLGVLWLSATALCIVSGVSGAVVARSTRRRRRTDSFLFPHSIAVGSAVLSTEVVVDGTRFVPHNPIHRQHTPHTHTPNNNHG